MSKNTENVSYMYMSRSESPLLDQIRLGDCKEIGFVAVLMSANSISTIYYWTFVVEHFVVRHFVVLRFVLDILLFDKTTLDHLIAIMEESNPGAPLHFKGRTDRSKRPRARCSQGLRGGS
jgi:hypothetical protein